MTGSHDERRAPRRVFALRLDPVRRRAVIDEIFHEDAVFYDPNGGIFRGRGEIDRIAGLIKTAHPDFAYQPLFPPEELGDAGRVRWVSGTPSMRIECANGVGAQLTNRQNLRSRVIS